MDPKNNHASKKRRKLVDENRKFKKEWETLYFFVQIQDKAMCLICHQYIHCFKSYNIRRHFEIRHIEWAKRSIEDKKAHLEFLMAGLGTDKTTLNLAQPQCTTESINDFALAIIKTPAMIASVRISNIVSDRLMIDGETIKQCLLVAAEEICPDKLDNFSQIDILPESVPRLGSSQYGLSKAALSTPDTNKFKHFSLAFDTMPEENGNFQLPVFIRGVDKNMTVTEEFLDVITINNPKPCDLDINKALMKCISTHKLDLRDLVAIATNGSPVMMGCFKLMLEQKKAVCVNNSEEMFFMSNEFLHMEKIFESLDTSQVFQPIVKAVEQIQENLNFEASGCISITHKYLEFFWSNLVMIKDKCIVPELKDDNWMLHLCFLIDIYRLLQDLKDKLFFVDNESLNDKPFITDFYEQLLAFVRKLQLLKKQVEVNNTVHLCLLNRFRNSSHNLDQISLYISELLSQFQKRLLQLEKFKIIFDVFMSPFHVKVENVPAYLQLEIIDLQSSAKLHDLFFNMNKIEFFTRNISENQFPHFKQLGLKIAAVIANTNLCESFFFHLGKLN